MFAVAFDLRHVSTHRITRLAQRMDLLDRVGQKGRNKNSPDRMGVFQPQRRKTETLLLARLSASLSKLYRAAS